MSCESGRVVALVMAAGKARRFGSDKRRALLDDGQSLLQHTLNLAVKNFPDVWLVIGAQDSPEALGVPASMRVIRAPAENVGLGTSLGAGFQRLIVQDASEAIAAAVMLADMPWILPETCRKLIEHAHSKSILRPRHGEKAGHPVVFGRTFWGRLAESSGEDGARALVKANSHACEFVEVKDPNIHRDVDTPLDLAIRGSKGR